MLVAHNFGVDWDEYLDKLFKPLDCINAEVMLEDIVDVLLTKGWALWEPDGTCMANNALLLCSTVNWSSNVTLTEPRYGHVISATVVWVALDQAWLSVPDAVTTLLDMAKKGQDGVALCYIPISRPFFLYPEDGPHVLVLPYNNNMVMECQQILWLVKWPATPPVLQWLCIWLHNCNFILNTHSALRRNRQLFHHSGEPWCCVVQSDLCKTNSSRGGQYHSLGVSGRWHYNWAT